MMRTFSKCLVLAVFAAATSTPAFAAGNGMDCTFAGGTQEVAKYAAVPAAVRAAIGEMAEKGAPWQVSDDVDPSKPMYFRRLLRAGHRGNDWFVWYEHGGIAYSWQAAAFRLEGGKARLLADVTLPVSWVAGGWSAKTGPCALIDGVFAGRIPPYPAGVSAETHF